MENIFSQLYRRMPIRIDETMVVMPLKHHVRLPTVSGVPVNFELNTTIVASLETELKGHQTAGHFWEMHFRPTFAVEVGVGLEADVRSVGIEKAKRVQFVNRLYAAPSVHMKTELKPETREMRVKLMMPEHEQTLLRFETEFNNDRESEVVFEQIPENSLVNRMIKNRMHNKRSTWFRESNKAHEQCIPAIDKMLGFTLCHQKYAVEDLKAALNTRSAKKIIYQSIYKIVKTDRDMEGWEFAVELPELYRSSKVQDEMKFKIHFDTPNSSIPRRFTSELLVHLPQNQEDKFNVELAVDAPLKKWKVGLLILNKPQQKTFKFEILSGNQERHFLLEGQTLWVQKSPKHTEAKIIFRLQPRPQIKPVEIEGQFILNVEHQEKKKLQVLFKVDETPIVDFSFVKSGSIFKPVDAKISMTGNVDFFNVKIRSLYTLSKNHEVGLIKSHGQIKYNRFWQVVRRSNDQEEVLNFSFQYSGFDRKTENREVKKFLQMTLDSTQFPLLNNELTYNVQGIFPAELSQELKFVYGQPEEQKRIRLIHQGRYQSNVRSRDLNRHQTDVEIEITPLNVHRQLTFVIENNQRAYNFDLKMLDKKTQEDILTSRFSYAIVQHEPLLMKASGEVKYGRYVFLYKDTVQEVSKNVFEGKLFIEFPHKFNTEVLAKKINLDYTLAMHEESKDRFDVVEREVLPIRYQIVQFLNRFHKFEHDLKVECNEHGLIRHTGLVTFETENKFVVKAELEHNNKPIYRLNTHVLPVEKRVKFEFQAPRWSQLKVDAEIEAQRILYRWIVKVQTEKFEHESRLIADKREQKWEVFSVIRKDQKVIYQLALMKESQLIKAEIVTPVLKTEITTEYLINSLRAFVQRHQTQDGLVKIFIELPKMELESKTQLRIIPHKRGVVLQHETMKKQQHIIKGDFKVLPEEKVLFVEFGKSNVYRAELVKPQNNVYELKSELRMEKKRLNHRASIVWRWTPSYQKNFVESFELVKFEMLNHLSEKIVFDAKYVKTEEGQYRHVFVVSTRKTHVELRLPALNEHDENVKALFTVKTKRFGGIEHKTEVTTFNQGKRHLIMNSVTERSGEQIVEVVADIVLRLFEESHLKIKVLNGKHALKFDILPTKWFNIEGKLGKKWQHEMKFDRKEHSKSWSVVLNTLNIQEQEKYFVRFEHRCDEYSNLFIELPIVRGNVEMRLDTYRIHFDLQGAKQFKNWTHKGHVQWNKREQELIVKSNTMNKQEEVVIVDLELSLHRSSTVKIVVLPFETKLNAKFDKREGAEIELAHKQWKHIAVMKRIQPREYMVRFESQKNQKVVVFVEASTILNRRITLKIETNTHKLPITFSGKYDHEERELFAEWHNKNTERVVKVDVQLKELENVRVEFSWDAKRDTTKKIALNINIQKPEIERTRFVAVIRGAIVFLPFELKVNMPRNVDNWFREYQHIEGQLKNLKNNEVYNMKYERKYENNIFNVELFINKNEFVIVKSEFNVDLAKENRKIVKAVLRSDFSVDILNFELELNRECSYEQCHTKAHAKYGVRMNKSIKFEGENVTEALRGSLVMEKDQEHKTIKFAFLKADSKLEINIFNQTSRLLDINIDLARPIQKKFQITSFIKSIPTINIETAHGENSRIVMEIINENEKKIELAFNWFGQWRHDFKLEVIFKFFAQPQIEMSIYSKHPAGVDEVDALLKIGENQYAAKYHRKFDNVNKNWTTKAYIQINGEKKFSAQIECQTEKKQNDRTVVTYTFQIEGVRRASGHLDIYLRPVVERRITQIESVEFELFNQLSKKLFGLEVFVQKEINDMKKTGLKITAYGQPVFGLIHMINESRNNKRLSMITLELPEEIEYVLRNEIQYENVNQIAVIRSELKKKNVSKPIYQTRIVFEHDRAEDMKVMKIEILNTVEQTQKPKLFVVRYNFAPKYCEVEDQQETRVDGLNKCIKIEVLAGDRERMVEKNQYALRIATQFYKYPIDSRHFNRTFQFALETVPEFETFQLYQQQPINFTMVAHVSKVSTGLKWFNINRHGQYKSGLIYADVKPFNGQDRMVNLYYVLNGQKTTGFDVHFSPEHFFSTFTVNARWNKDIVRRWIVGELPELNEMLHKPSKFSQLKRRLVRELREEYEHKIAYLKRNNHKEVIQPITDEWIRVQQQLIESEGQVAKIVAKIYKIVVERVKVVLVRLLEETHSTYDDIMTQIVGTFQQIKRDIVQLLKKNCYKTDVCRKTIEQIEEFEIENLFRGDFGKTIKKALNKIQRAMPEDLEETMRGLAKEINSWQPENIDEYNCEDNEIDSIRRYYRHGSRLLKMVQPELYETVVHRLKEMTDKVQENKPINMAEIRGQMHDLIVDMFDSFERKTEEPVKMNFTKYNKTERNMLEDEPKMIFSPKRGEFSFLNTQKPIWTRA